MLEMEDLITSKVREAMRSSGLDAEDRVALEKGLLPLFNDLAYRYYLRSDGALFVIDALDPESGFQEETDPTRKLALHRIVVEDNPELQALIPARPNDKTDCTSCGGSGRAPMKTATGKDWTTICLVCSGTGWVSASKATV